MEKQKTHSRIIRIWACPAPELVLDQAMRGFRPQVFRRSEKTIRTRASVETRPLLSFTQIQSRIEFHTHT